MYRVCQNDARFPKIKNIPWPENYKTVRWPFPTISSTIRSSDGYLPDIHRTDLLFSGPDLLSDANKGKIM